MTTTLLFGIYLNLGRFLDATVEPTKTGLLVCLGGGDFKIRVEKTMELYEEGFLNSDTVVLTGYVNSKREIEKGIVEDKRVSYIKQRNAHKLKIILNKDLKNTADEVKYIKTFMLANGFNSATFISEPPHSRRILLLFKIISIEGDKSLAVNVVGADYKNWDAGNYYEDEYAKNYAFTEVVKTFYALFAYGILDKLGLLESFEERFQEDIQKSRKNLTKGMNFISS